MKYKLKNQPLRNRLSIYILLIALGILIAIYATNYIVSRSIILSGIEEDARNITESKVNKMETFLSNVERVPIALAAAIQSYQFDSVKTGNMIKDLINLNPGVYGMCVAFEPGVGRDSSLFAPYYYRDGKEIRFADLAKEEYGYQLWDWYQIPYTLKTPIWSEPYYDKGGGENLMITYGVPIFDPGTGKVKGIVTADIDLTELKRVISEIKIFNDGYAFAISRFGTYISHKHAPFILDETIFSLAEEKDDKQLALLGKKMISGETGFQEINDVVTEDQFRIYYMPLKSAGWSVGIMIPEDELFSGLYFLNNMILLVGFTGASILAIFIFIVIGKTTKPVSKISEVLELVAAGNLGAAVTKLQQLQKEFKGIDLANKSSKDEIVKLWNFLRKMTFDIRGLSIRIKSAGNYLNSSAETLKNAVGFLHNTFSQQDTANKNMRHYGEEIDRVTKSLAEDTEKLTLTVEDTAGLLVKGQENIGNIGQSITEISQSTGSLVQKLNTINKRTANISRVITTISNIADRTNLISLNAAIEAEKAGDAGIGFKVIADEIKRLSENTFNSLSEIGEIIEDVQSSVSDGVDTVQIYHTKSLSGLKEIMLMIEDLNIILEKNKELIPQFVLFKEAMNVTQDSVLSITGNLATMEKLGNDTKDALNNMLQVAVTVNEAIEMLDNEVNKIITD